MVEESQHASFILNSMVMVTPQRAAKVEYIDLLRSWIFQLDQLISKYGYQMQRGTDNDLQFH
jgi:hypothetical protein